MPKTPPAPAKALKSTAESLQETFFACMGWGQELRLLIDHLDGVTLFVKDRDSRFMAFSRSAKRCLDYVSEDDLIGRTDHDVFPIHVADRIRADDVRVMNSDLPLLNIVELLVSPQHCSIGWYVTSKFPIHDRSGQVIGVMGMVQPYEGRRKKLLEGTRLDNVVERIRHQPAVDHPVSELARMVGMSPRQLQRKFRELLGLSPREFMMFNRIKLACEELTQTQHHVAEIAQDCGFCDQSAFAYQFRHTIGMSPLEYRQRYFATARSGERK